MGFKVNFRKIDKLEILLKKKFKGAVSDRGMLKEVGEFSVDRIRANARKGKPARQDGSISKFPNLKESTKRIRKSLSKYNDTHATFRFNRSNVTFTGQLLDHVRFKILKDKIELFIKGSRRLYRERNNKVLKGQERTSEEVYKKLVELNTRYKFLALDSKGIERTRRIVLRFLRKSLSLKKK